MPAKYSRDDCKRFREVCPSDMLFWPDEQLAREMERRGWPVGVLPQPIAGPRGLTVDRSKPFDTAGFSNILLGFTIAEPEDGRSLALAKIDASSIRLKTMIKNHETRITGEESLRRFKAELGYIRLDAQVLQTFWENQDLIPEHWKYKTDGYTTYIHFDGTILQSPSGFRSVLYFYWSGARWSWGCVWLESGRFAFSPSAVLAS